MDLQRQRRLAFLTEASGLSAEKSLQIFQNQHFHFRKSLQQLLAKTDNPDLALRDFLQKKGLAQCQALALYLSCFVPNPAWQAVLERLRSRQIEQRPDTEGEKQLLAYRAAPPASAILALLDGVEQRDENLLALFEGLRPFGSELLPHLLNIQAYAREPDAPRVVEAALDLIGYIPQGPERSLGLLAEKIQNPQERFWALSCLSRARQLDPAWLFALFRPFFEDQKRLSRSEGSTNLDQDCALMLQILRKQGTQGLVLFHELNTRKG